MDESSTGPLLPVQVRQSLAFALTVAAALLYAILMGVVLLSVIREPTFDPNENIVRAVGILGGLVGSVVTAGFARSQPATAIHLSREHPLGKTVTAWGNLGKPSLTRRNLLGLAELIGLPSRTGTPLKSGEAVEEPAKATTAVWVALVYVAVYLIVGLCSLVVSFLYPGGPDLVSQAGWVWIGTALSSAYAFFGLDRSE